MPTILKTFILALTKNLTIGLGGLQGFIAKQAMKYGGQLLYDLVMDLYRRFQRYLDQKAVEKKYMPIINSPTASIEEKANAYEAMINGKK